MTERRVVYLISGPPHLLYLVTSLVALHRIWDGQIIVYAWPASIRFVRRMAEDERLGIEAIERKPTYKGKNAQFFDKIRMMQAAPPGTNLYLDADTIPVRRHAIDRLFELAEEREFCATQFCNYVSTGQRVSKRIRRLEGREGIDQECVQFALANKLPSVNGGIFACRPDTKVLPLWEEWTSKVLDIFIADETALHAVMARYWNTDIFDVAIGGGFNCSPLYQPKELADKDVGIWHGHGDCWSRISKSPKGVGLWWPRYQECLKENIGGLAVWKDEAISRKDTTTRGIKRLESTPDGVCVFCGYGRKGFSGQHHVKSCPKFKG